MALSKAGLTKALKKYKPMQEQGKTVDEITTELQVDHNGYAEDEVKQILDALGIDSSDAATDFNDGNTPLEPSAENEQESKKTIQLPDHVSEKLQEASRSVGNYNQAQDLASILAGIDYKNLVGDNFKKYVELVGDRSFMVTDDRGKQKPIVGKLRQDQSYDFEQYRVKPVRKERFPGMKDSPWDFIGIEITKDKPEHTTRIPVSIALEFNAQILNAHSVAGHGKYYLLKK